MDGIVAVYKEKGWTSFDVIAKVRGILHTRKVGHTGTLDPMAEGVVLVCAGQATRLCSLIEGMHKEYLAGLLLGVSTDSQDITGNVTEKKDVSVSDESEISLKSVKEAAASFLGDYDQIPPMHSAKSIDGVRLYELAHEGITVERKAARVHIYKSSILSEEEAGAFLPDKISEEKKQQNIAYTLRKDRDYLLKGFNADAKKLSEGVSTAVFPLLVNCSRGTYIRTLCYDIGKKLKVPACMSSLVRLSVGNFSIKDTYTVDELDDMMHRGDSSFMLSIDEAIDKIMNLPSAKVTEEENVHVINGATIPSKEVIVDIKPENNLTLAVNGEEKTLFKMHTVDGRCVGIYEKVRDKEAAEDVFKPYKMFKALNTK